MGPTERGSDEETNSKNFGTNKPHSQLLIVRHFLLCTSFIRFCTNEMEVSVVIPTINFESKVGFPTVRLTNERRSCCCAALLLKSRPCSTLMPFHRGTIQYLTASDSAMSPFGLRVSACACLHVGKLPSSL